MRYHVIIVGTGLIGCSFALALRRAGVAEAIAAADTDEAHLAAAIAGGAVERAATDADWRAADLVFLAVPVGAVAGVLRDLRDRIGPDVAVMDGCSTKAGVVSAAREALGAHWPRFVPTHPIAGRERHGPAAADAALFTGRNVVLTPLAETAADALARATAVWAACGARVLHMTPDAHDRVFAAVSHLPHLLAYALVDELALRGDAAVLFEHAASGFRDFTRIASSSPIMWRDVALANRVAIGAELDRYIAKLIEMRQAVADGDGEALYELMRRAQTARDGWLEARNECATGKGD